MSLSQNNPVIRGDRNPIPFNAPGLYQCQPGKCVYGAVSNGNPVSLDDELYYYCGGNAKVEKNDTCIIQDSTSVIDQIIQFGAFGVNSEVTTVSDVSAGEPGPTTSLNNTANPSILTQTILDVSERLLHFNCFQSLSVWWYFLHP